MGFCFNNELIWMLTIADEENESEQLSYLQTLKIYSIFDLKFIKDVKMPNTSGNHVFDILLDLKDNTRLYTVS